MDAAREAEIREHMRREDERYKSLPWRWEPGTGRGIAPDIKPRRIQIDVYTWEGMSLGASHWRVEVKVQGNEKTYLDEEGKRRYWGRIGKGAELEAQGVDHEAKFETPQLAAKWGRYAAGKLLEQFPGSVVEWRYPENERRFGDTDAPFPGMYWIARSGGFLWYDEAEHADDPVYLQHMRSKGYYDWPAWDHPERRRYQLQKGGT